MSVTLQDRLTALRAAASLAGGRVDDEPIERATAVVERAGARLDLGLEATVVALAGPTGAGKSSLFNALAGEALAEPGHRRPTTSTATAAIWGDEAGDDLLDWLVVPRRHRLDGTLDGLVLLDLPDFDSVAATHRVEADRVIALADLVVWVVDPQKYADGVLHDEYLRPRAGSSDTMLVVLNQADRLDPAARRACIADIDRLLTLDGLPDVPVLAVSATDGMGIAELRDELERRVRRREQALARIAADAAAAASQLAEAVGTDGAPGDIRRQEVDHLAASLASAAGVPTVVRAVRAAHRRRGALATGWPVVRGLRRLRPDPLRRLRLDRSAAEAGDPTPRTSLRAASPVQVAQADNAARQLAAHAAGDLREPWPRLLRVAATSNDSRLHDRLDAAVAGSDLRMRKPYWWRAVGALQWVLLVASIIGAIWLAGIAALDFLQLDEVVPTPELEQLPVPTLLAVGGALAGVVLALLSGFLNRFGAARRARIADRTLRCQVRDVGRELVIAPVERELQARAELLHALRTAAGAGPTRRAVRRGRAGDHALTAGRS